MTKPVGFLLIGIVSLACGCNRDPGCQRTIGLLRAEKLQLEDEYFALKHKYEMAVAQHQVTAGSAAPADPDIIFENQETPDEDEDLLEGPTIIIEGEPTGSAVRRPHGNSANYNPGLRSPNPAGMSNAQMARYIRSIDVSQLSNLEPNKDLRILVRPLDENGEIIPIAGDLKIGLVDSSRANRRIASWQFDQPDVARWVDDQPGSEPGIHVRLPLQNAAPPSGRLVLEVIYRTADNRNIKFQRQLAAAPDNQGDLNLGFESVDGLLVEIGDETNFENIESTDASQNHGRSLSPPRWKPDR